MDIENGLKEICGEVCKKCNGTGHYHYDENHGTICDECCKHDHGWFELKEGYAGFKHGENNLCCKAGCGTMQRDLEKK